MKDNVIVLTTGLSGSSVTTALIAQSGLWLGKETIVKNNSSGQYDTYENIELVELNQRLFDSMCYKDTKSSLYDPRVFEMFSHCHNRIDTVPYENFIIRCNKNGPWLWKDPRMWSTLGFWLPLLKQHCGKSIRFVLLSRQPLSLWISLLLKRNIISYNYLKQSESSSSDNIKSALELSGFKHGDLNYNDLLSAPEITIEKLNRFLDNNLSMNDLQRIFNGHLPAAPWEWKNLIKASLIYAKNYREA